MKADPHVQLQLLDLQELDSRIDQLQHRLATVPEAQALRDLLARRTATENSLRDHRITVSDLTAEQERADADVEAVRARRERDQGMIDAGQVKDPKALERMLGELESLHRRITALEDVEIEVMERLEATQMNLDVITAELAEIDAEAARLAGARDEKTSALEADLATARQERDAAADGVPEDLTALYEKVRANKGGVGAAALRRRACGGCNLTLNAADLAAIAARPADDVVRCEECNRILVRTEESGL